MAKQKGKLYVDPTRDLVYRVLVQSLRNLRQVHRLDEQPDGRDVAMDIISCALQDAGIHNHRLKTVQKNKAQKAKKRPFDLEEASLLPWPRK